MEEKKLLGLNNNRLPKVQIIKDINEKKVLVSGKLYMCWKLDDQYAQRIAIVSLYKSKICTQEELADIFSIHIKSIYNYIASFERGGMEGLIGSRRGPKRSWKLISEVKGKILYEVLHNNIKEYQAIQKELKLKWQLKISKESIRQVLVENGLAMESNNSFSSEEQLNFYDEPSTDQLNLNLNYGNTIGSETTMITGQSNNKSSEFYNWQNSSLKGMRHYSSAEREYLNKLEVGEYNTYGGGMLFLAFLEHYQFLEMIKHIINIKTYEGYSLEQLCLCLFYFDLFGFQSIENFKTVYSDEYGLLLGKLTSPSIYTLRRFLHKIRKLNKAEELIEEFGKGYLKSGLVKWGVLYIDSHFLPYYGFLVISMGWYTVRNKALKGSYNFIANDEEFNPLIFLIRPSSEDLLEKIPEIINKSKKIAKEVGIDSKNLTVIFDREGYCAELFRKLDGEEGLDGALREGEEKVKFITWAKYADKWVNDFDENKFTEEVIVEYKIRKKKTIYYFDTKRSMSKYGKIRAIVIANGPEERRMAIYIVFKKNILDYFLNYTSAKLS